MQNLSPQSIPWDKQNPSVLLFLCCRLFLCGNLSLRMMSLTSLMLFRSGSLFLCSNLSFSMVWFSTFMLLFGSCFFGRNLCLSMMCLSLINPGTKLIFCTIPRSEFIGFLCFTWMLLLFGCRGFFGCNLCFRMVSLSGLIVLLLCRLFFCRNLCFGVVGFSLVYPWAEFIFGAVPWSKLVWFLWCTSLMFLALFSCCGFFGSYLSFSVMGLSFVDPWPELVLGAIPRAKFIRLLSFSSLVLLLSCRLFGSDLGLGVMTLFNVNDLTSSDLRCEGSKGSLINVNSAIYSVLLSTFPLTTCLFSRPATSSTPNPATTGPKAKRPKMKPSERVTKRMATDQNEIGLW